MNLQPASLHNRMPALTGLRFMAAMMIFCYHYIDFISVRSGKLYAYLDHFHWGVQIFFVLSGFLIAQSYSEKISSGTLRQIDYFKKRLIRIMPLYLLLTILTYIVIGKNFQNWGSLGLAFFFDVTLLKGFSSQYLLSGIPQSWSLATEMQFYASAPFLMKVSRKNTGWWVVIGFIAVGTLVGLVFQKFSFYGFFSSVKFVLVTTLFGRILEFYLGILLYNLISGKTKVRALSLLGRLRYKSFWGLTLMTVSLCAASSISTFLLDNSECWISLHWLLGYIIFPFCVMLFIYGLCSEKNGMVDLLSSRLMQILGNSSYAFFLLHAGVFSTFLMKYLKPLNAEEWIPDY